MVGLTLVSGLLLGIRVVRAGGDDSAAVAPPVSPTAPADAGAVAVAAHPDTVPFNHSIHAGTYRMACLSCHVDADKSTTAGMPSVSKCLGCHKFVDKQKPAVQELARLWEDEEVPRWTRVYELPDYVYFSHRVHVTAQVACSQCHGDVASMSRITRVSSLTMGWCLTCHEEKHATRDCVACHK
jgi:Cytochrome c7 and related cytochrome c/Class III cytochrome C family